MSALETCDDLKARDMVRLDHQFLDHAVVGRFLATMSRIRCRALPTVGMPDMETVRPRRRSRASGGRASQDKTAAAPS